LHGGSFYVKDTENLQSNLSSITAAMEDRPVMRPDTQALEWNTLKEELEEAWRQIPKPFRSERSIHSSLKCCLYNRLRQAGYAVVADYMPPRVQDRSVDVIALNDKHEVMVAVCIDTVVTLAAVKSLGSFEASQKLVLTTGSLVKKVQESRFFLKPGIDHLHLQPFGHVG
jgi:hypothetical protein